ncbi:Integrator complex subunit 4 [Rhizopus azygosporus]|uniref:Integrator complex subunit 4 n=2 Tax=Rhizopus TaxID=4842 RepID=A0A367JXG8_RHIAZ|nr:Integrator complex subunit 4 [Rhizopus azygosporus]
MKRGYEAALVNRDSSITVDVPIVDHASIEWIPSFDGLSSNLVQDRIKTLLDIARYVFFISLDQQTTLTQALLDRLEVETDNDAKAMIILLIEKCCQFPNINNLLIFQRLLAQRRRIAVDEHSKLLLLSLFEQLMLDLSSTHHKVRAAVIPLLSLLPFVLKKLNMDKGKIMSEMEIQKVISQYAKDQDPRVRKSALDSLVQMHQRGCPLDLSIYHLSVAALRDDYEEVRMGGLNLMGVLSSLYPEHRLKLAHEEITETTRLIDDAFNKVCDLVNDSAVMVRTKACVMMASYQNVGTDMLKQTFSKQIMSHLKRSLPKWRMQQKKYANGMIPVAEGDFDVESDEFHLLDSGACGAFIHGLEDEYQEVRYASIDSIGELCLYNEELTKKAVENLVDMFNDEIDKIRVNAIQSLRKIGTRSLVEFDEEQLEIAVGALEDKEPVARHATHDLFTVIRLTQQSSMTTLLTALEANMKRYPEDMLSIYRCLGRVGKRHDDYVENLIPHMLKLDRRFLPREPNVDDMMYTAYVILIANACVSNMRLLTSLPKYIFRHFAYFKSKYSDCLPDLRKLYKNAGIKLEGDVDCLPMTFNRSKKATTDDAEIYTKATVEMLQVIQTQIMRNDEYKLALVTLEAAARNFKYIASLKPVDAGKSDLGQLYLECYNIMIKIKQSHSVGVLSPTVRQDAALLFKYSYTIEHTFLGLSVNVLHAAALFRILGNMVWLFSVVKQMPVSGDTSFDLKHMLIAAKQRVELVQSCFQHKVHDNTILDDLKNDLVKAIELPNTSNMTALYSFITSFLPVPMQLDNNPVKHTSAVITYPLPNADKPLKYNAIYKLKLHVEADIFNVNDITYIAIEVILPNESSHVFWPAYSHFKPATPLSYKLSTDIELELPPWTEAAPVKIQVIVSFEPDLPGLDEYIMTSVKTASAAVSEPLSYVVFPQSH